MKNAPYVRTKAFSSPVYGLFGGEHILAHAAEGAGEIFGKILELGAGSDAVFGIAELLIIDPAACFANVFHIGSPFVSQ